MAEKIGTALERGQALPVGTKLAARYKGVLFNAEVLGVEPFRLKVDGLPLEYSSLSHAASGICTVGDHPTSVNGWRFWRLGAAPVVETVRRGRGRPRKGQGAVAAPGEPNTGDVAAGDDATCAGSAGEAELVGDETFVRLVCQSCGKEVANFSDALEHQADAGHPFEVPEPVV